MNMNKRIIAFTLIELLVVVAIIALLIAILLPSLAKARETAKRGACAQNLKGIATASKTYAVDNQGWWPTVGSWYDSNEVPTTLPGAADPFKNFITSMGGTTALPRDQESVELIAKSANAKATHVSPSRAFWTLVRRGDVTAANFICPSSDDNADTSSDTLRFYDFKGYSYLSYAYQMPFFTRFNQCRPRQSIDVDPRTVYLGDKSPGITASKTVQAVESASGTTPEIVAFNSAYVGTGTGGDGGTPLQNVPPANDIANDGLGGANVTVEQLKPFNSPNHGGRGRGEGQNVGRSDGSVEFAKTPLVGVDRDNVYSVVHPVPTHTFEYRYLTGVYPGTSSGPGSNSNLGCPGYKGISNNRHASTDSVLVP